MDLPVRDSNGRNAWRGLEIEALSLFPLQVAVGDESYKILAFCFYEGSYPYPPYPNWIVPSSKAAHPASFHCRWLWKDERIVTMYCFLGILVQVAITVVQPIVLSMLFDVAIAEKKWKLMGWLVIALVGIVCASAQADYRLDNDIPSGNKFVPFWQLRLGKHVSNMPQHLLDGKNL